MSIWTRLPRWARLAALGVSSRLLVLGAMVAGSYFPRRDDDLHWIANDGSFYWDQVPVRVLDVWGRWDTMFYWRIARFGYPPAHEGWVYDAAYFPLFPAMMRGLSRVLFDLEPYLAGVALTFTFYALALVYFDRLVRLDHPPELAERVLLLLVTYPGAHFLTCVYPESATLFLAVFAVYNARTNRPVVAALACMLAAVARASGIFVCAAVFLELLRENGRWRWHPRVLLTVLAPAALACWMALNHQLYGDALYFVHVQQGWGRHPSFPLAPFFSLKLTPDYHLLALAGLALMVYGWRVHERPAHATLATLNTLLPLSTGMLRGVHRYMGSNYPLFLFAARFFEGRRRWLTAWVALSVVLLTFFAFKWGQGREPN